MSRAMHVAAAEPRPEPESDAAYEGDVYSWAMQQARLIRAGRIDAIDRENVAEEIESVGRSHKTELRSRIRTLVEHLLKLECSSAIEPRRGWADTVRRTRIDIEDLLDDAPSLRRELPAMLEAVQDKTSRLTAASLEDAGESTGGIEARMTSGGLREDEVFGSWMPGEPE